MSSFEGHEISWDGLIENESPEFVTLPEGDYDFEVVNFERARHNGSDKLPPCNKAIVHLKIEGAEGSTIIKHNLFLHSLTEGILCAFFTSIGQRKKGERVNMNWSRVIGSRGRAKVYIDKWKSDDGTKEYSANKIKRFLEPTDAGQQPQVSGYQPGRF